MKKKIKSAVISIVVIAVLLLAILIGVKNGTLDKLTKEMPTLATNQAETEKATVNARNNSTESKPYDGIEVAEYGEEFVIRRKIDGRKYDENDRTTYNIYHVKVNDCKISRQCDFDINRLDFGLDNKKKSLDENNNFISDFYYATVELEITKDIDDNDVMDYMNPSKISKKVYVDEAIRPVLTTYYKQLTEIAEYFSYIDKCADVKFNLNEMCDGIESDSNINMPENIKKDIYDLMYNVSVEVEVKDNTLVVSFDKLFADNSTFTYKINICLKKKPEYKYQYVIGYAKLCERWYYSEERKYNME